MDKKSAKDLLITAIDSVSNSEEQKSLNLTTYLI